jgi:hypothetical protein
VLLLHPLATLPESYRPCNTESEGVWRCLEWGIPYVVDRKSELAATSGDRPEQRRQRTPCQKGQQQRDLGHSVRIPHICVAIRKVVELMVASSVTASLSTPPPARPPATISLCLKQPLLQLVSSRCSLNWIEGDLADLFEVLLVGQPGSLKLIKTESSTFGRFQHNGRRRTTTAS